MLNKEWKFLLLIIVIFITACIETDIYLPAFTDMMAYFSISEDQIQGLLTWNFIGICLSGPLYGPISDSIGRKKPLMIALGLFLIGSVMTLFANDFSVMLFGRVLQGLGSGGCFTLGTAILFDVFQEKQAIQAINKINSIVPVIMALAPMAGGYLNNMYGFRSNFLAIAICVIISFIISLFFFGETLVHEKRAPLDVKKILANFKKVSLSLPFWQTTFIVSLLFGGYIVFLSGISVLFVIEYGISKQVLPFYQASLLLAWLVASLTSRYVIEKFGIEKVKKMGIIQFALGGVGLLLVALFDPQNTYLLTLPMMLNAFGSNWTQGIYFPEGMELFPEIKGITASLLTSARLLLSAMIVGIASYFYNFTIFPIAITVFSLTAVILLIIFFYERKRVRSPEPKSDLAQIDAII